MRTLRGAPGLKKKRVLAEWIKAGNKRTAENQEQSECANERLYLSIA